MLPYTFLSLIYMHRHTLSVMHLCLKMHTRAMYDSELVFVNIYIYQANQTNGNNISPTCSFLDVSFTYLCSSYFLFKIKPYEMICLGFHKDINHRAPEFLINSIRFILQFWTFLDVRLCHHSFAFSKCTTTPD